MSPHFHINIQLTYQIRLVKIRYITILSQCNIYISCQCMTIGTRCMNLRVYQFGIQFYIHFVLFGIAIIISCINCSYLSLGYGIDHFNRCVASHLSFLSLVRATADQWPHIVLQCTGSYSRIYRIQHQRMSRRINCCPTCISCLRHHMQPHITKRNVRSQLNHTAYFQTC